MIWMLAIVGGLMTLVIFACLKVASDADDEMERENRKRNS